MEPFNWLLLRSLEEQVRGIQSRAGLGASSLRPNHAQISKRRQSVKTARDGSA